MALMMMDERFGLFEMDEGMGNLKWMNGWMGFIDKMAGMDG